MVQTIHMYKPTRELLTTHIPTLPLTCLAWRVLLFLFDYAGKVYMEGHVLIYVPLKAGTNSWLVVYIGPKNTTCFEMTVFLCSVWIRPKWLFWPWTYGCDCMLLFVQSTVSLCASFRRYFLWQRALLVEMMRHSALSYPRPFILSEKRDMS